MRTRIGAGTHGSCCNRALCAQRGLEAIAWRAERRAKGIPGHAKDLPVLGFDRFPEDGIVAREQRG